MRCFLGTLNFCCGRKPAALSLCSLCWRNRAQINFCTSSFVSPEYFATVAARTPSCSWQDGIRPSVSAHAPELCRGLAASCVSPRPVWRLKPGPWLLSRAHGGDPVRGKGSRAHGTGGKLLPCAPRGLVRTESASCARRCFTPPYCPTPRCSSHAAPLFRSLAEQTPAGAPSARWERKPGNRLTPGREAGHRRSCRAHSPAR